MDIVCKIRAAGRMLLACVCCTLAGFAFARDCEDIAGGVAIGCSPAEVCEFDSADEDTGDSGGTHEAVPFVEVDVTGGVAVGCSPAEICSFDSTGEDADDSAETDETETFPEADIAGGVAAGSSPAEICCFDSTGEEDGETGETKIFTEADLAGGVAAGSSPAELFLASGAYVIIGDGTNVVFCDSAIVTMSHSENAGGEIRYTLDGTEPNADSPIFEKQFVVTTTTVVKAVAELEGVVSEVTFTLLTPDPIPEIENPTSEKIRSILEKAVDGKLVTKITDEAEYVAFREWSGRVRSQVGGTTPIGAAGVMAAPYAWLSYALGSETLIETALTDSDLKVEAFEPKSDEAGKFDFTVSVKNVEIGSDASKENLKRVFGLEGGTSLGGMSSENVDITFETPYYGKVKFTAWPNAKNADAKTFFMKVKMNQ